MTKDILRKKYKLLRNQLSKDESDKKSVAIAKQLLAHYKININAGFFGILLVDPLG